ncbi:MAG: hypothetical protein ACHQD8_06840 [Chitinophagales bacterium]
MEKVIQNNEQGYTGVSKHADNGVAKNTTRHRFPLAKAIAKYKANIQFKKFKRALKEVEQIEAGIIKPKSLQQLLNEL